jgi:hypothetical protein
VAHFDDQDVGPGVMRFLDTSAGERVSDADMDGLALALRRALAPG